MAIKGFAGNLIGKGDGSRERKKRAVESRNNAIQEGIDRRQNLNKFGDGYNNRPEPNSRGFAKTVVDRSKERSTSGQFSGIYETAATDSQGRVRRSIDASNRYTRDNDKRLEVRDPHPYKKPAQRDPQEPYHPYPTLIR